MVELSLGDVSGREGGEEQGVEEGKSFCLDRLGVSLFTHRRLRGPPVFPWLLVGPGIGRWGSQPIGWRVEWDRRRIRT